jgi:hypothetical protein
MSSPKPVGCFHVIKLHSFTEVHLLVFLRSLHFFLSLSFSLYLSIIYFYNILYFDSDHYLFEMLEGAKRSPGSQNSGTLNPFPPTFTFTATRAVNTLKLNIISNSLQSNFNLRLSSTTGSDVRTKILN